MNSVIGKILFLLSLLGAIEVNAQALHNENESITTLPNKVIRSVDAENITDAPILFVESLYLPGPEEQGDISTYSLSDPGYVWNVDTNQTYSNAFDSSTTNHYYSFTISNSTKVTARNWNIPAASDFDIALYKWSTNTSSWNMVTLSQVIGASEEQLSYIAEPDDYLFEVAMTGAVDTSTYNFTITTQSTYDNQEADDNYWEARVQSNFEQVVGTIDNNYDKDFIQFTNTKTETVNYSIIGGDYTAELKSSNGSPAFTLSSNSLSRLSIPAGTWYWVISSPSHSVNPATNYTFNQQKDFDKLTITFNSDAQTNYSKRVDWGMGKYFPIEKYGTISGVAVDDSGNPVGDTIVKIVVCSSVSLNNDLTFYASTDDNGGFSKTINSPLGKGSNTYMGGALLYYYDIHTVKINVLDAAKQIFSIPSIVEVDDVSRSTSYNSTIKLNDVAYYIYP